MTTGPAGKAGRAAGSPAPSAGHVLRVEQVFRAILQPSVARVPVGLERRGIKGAEAEVIAQEVMLHRYKDSVERGRLPDSAPAMVNALTTNRISTYARGCERDRTVGGLDPGELPGSDPGVERVLRRKRLARAVLARLSEEHGAVLERIQLGETAHAAVMAELGLPERAVTSRIASATARAIHYPCRRP